MIDHDETELLEAFEQGQLKSAAAKSELAKFKAAARATALKDRRVNSRLSSGDLPDIQIKALEESIPYQTLIANVLLKYLTGRLTERPVASRPATKSQAPKQERSLISRLGDEITSVTAGNQGFGPWPITTG